MLGCGRGNLGGGDGKAVQLHQATFKKHKKFFKLLWSNILKDCPCLGYLLLFQKSMEISFPMITRASRLYLKEAAARGFSIDASSIASL